MSSRIVGLLLVFGVASLCQGLSVSPCSSNGTIAVEENSKDFVFTCGSDLDMQNPTTWTFQDHHQDPQQVISVCSRSPPTSSSSPWSCASNYSVMIIASINEHTRRSHIILPDVIRGRFPDGTWRCENGASVAECSIDVVHTPSDVQCQVTVDEDQGMVHGTCQTSKMFSSHANYVCQWFEKNGNKVETEIPATDTEFTLTACAEGRLDYVCGNCSFSKLLPFVSESYSYRVVISPGSISPSIGYSIVKAKANSLSSTQEGLPASVPRMTSTQSATSSRTMTSLRSGLTLKQSSPNPPTVEVNEEVVNSARYEGIGIGVAACIALLTLIALLVCVAFKCRRNKEREDDPRNSIINHSYDPTDFPQNHVGNCENNLHLSNTTNAVSNGVPSQTSIRSFDSQPDGGYASIASPFDSDAASYLVPFVNGRAPSTTLAKEPCGNEDRKGGDPARTLPPVPASGSDVATGGSHDDKACRDHTYKSRISMDLPPTGYETMHAPLSTQSKFNPSSQHTKSEGKMEEEEEENLENEKAEAAEANFLASGFQMKDAEYVHINNSGIPLSDLV